MKNRTDENIKKDIVDQLYWDARVDASNIKIDIDKGNVKLSGKVPNYSTKNIAEELIWTIKGIKKITNNLTVNLPPKITIPTDKEIKKRIEENFKWSPTIQTDDININVNHGIVTMTGAVNRLWKKTLAETLVENTRGVVDILNKITIIPSENVVDEVIAKNVVNAINRSALVEVNDLNVKVDDGKVYISGVVDNSTQFFEAEKAVSYTVGVKGVKNNLIIEV